MCPRRKQPEEIGISALIERLSDQLDRSETRVTMERLLVALDLISPRDGVVDKSRLADTTTSTTGLHPDAVRILLRCGFSKSRDGNLVIPDRGLDGKHIAEAQEAKQLIDVIVISMQEDGTAPPAKTEPPEASTPPTVAPADAGPPSSPRPQQPSTPPGSPPASRCGTPGTAPTTAGPSGTPSTTASSPGTAQATEDRGSSPSTDANSARGSPSPAQPLSDREVAERLAQELAREDEPKVVQFQRFCSERVLVDPSVVEEINKHCTETGEKYVDPQFPPTNKSIYMSEWEADHWQCLSCQAHTRLPPVPPLPASKEEAKKQEEEWKSNNKCSGCGQDAHYVVQVRFFTRPTQWLRPGNKCSGCEFLYSQLPTDRDLVSHMCTHFIRDQLSQCTVGAPWKLIREEARSEDVCQGGLGNCWFAGALSVVAGVPKLIEKLFFTKEYNPNGVYYMQLCHAGEWRGIVLDDLLPTSQVGEGYVSNNTIYYSRGGTLCYLHGARRQLWVPLVEKGAAKLFGSYGALKGGTFGEAMGLFTGFPTERIKLYVPKALRKARAERRAARIARRTQALLRGGSPIEDDSDDSDANDDMTWSRLLSCKEAGYLMGMGCTEEGCEKTKHHIVEVMGLQAPHAYGIMDLKDAVVNGERIRFMKIRNPWGERAPRTWKGAWGKDSDKWTHDLKLELGVINSSGVTMDDPMSIFWMDFKDVKEYFPAVEVCRIHANWKEVRRKAWLPSGAGPGEAFDLTVFRKTRLDIAVWQEKHSSREGALGARSTNIDVGLAVMRRRVGTASQGAQVDFELVDYLQRECSDDVSGEMILEGGYVYRLVPLSFGLLQEQEGRCAVVAVHSVYSVELELVTSSWGDIARACFEGVRKRGRRWPDRSQQGISYWLLHEAGGSALVAENTSSSTAAIQVDASDSLGCVSSRGSLGIIARVPARSRQVLLALAFSPAAPFTRISIQPQPVPLELAPVVEVSANPSDAHGPVPLLPSEWRSARPPPPDQDILRRAPQETEPLPEAPAASSAAPAPAASSAASSSASATSPTPVRQSSAVGVEEDEDLAAALRLSLDLNGPVSGLEGRRPFSPAANPLPARGAETSGSSTLGGASALLMEQNSRIQQTARVKELWQQYKAAGMAPNEAAARAQEEAQREFPILTAM